MNLPARILTFATMIFAAAALLLKWSFPSHAKTALAFAYVLMLLLVIDLIIKNGRSLIKYSILMGFVVISDVGYLFKIMHWPYAAVLIVAGSIALLLSGLLIAIPAFQSGDWIKAGMGAAICIASLSVIVFSFWHFSRSALNTITYPCYGVIVSTALYTITRNTSRHAGETTLVLFLGIYHLLKLALWVIH